MGLGDPVVRDTLVDSEALIAGLGTRVWKPQTMALFDMCFFDTDTKSYLSFSPGPGAVFCSLLKRSGNSVMLILGIIPPLHLCAFQWMVLLVMRLLVF